MEENQANDTKRKAVGLVVNQSEFAANLLTALTAVDQKHCNLICSPLSIQSAMTICMVGARRNTVKEMMDVLYPNDPQKDIAVNGERVITSEIVKLCKYYNTKFRLRIVNNHQHPMVRIVNKLWIVNNFKIINSYHNASGLDTVGYFDKSQGQQSADIVNQWISQNTNNKIKQIVDRQIMSESDMLITNAIYFSSKFMVPFDKERTEHNVPFGDHEPLIKSREVTMMYSKAQRFFALKVNEIWDVVKLECAHSSLSLFLVINNHGDGCEAELSTNELMNWCPSTKRQCELWVPKFRFEGEMKLNSALKGMGMVDVFDEKSGDFHGIDESGEPFVTSVIHKAVIEMHEEGPEAPAAALYPQLMDSYRNFFTKPTPVVPKIRFDRPFTFHIIDEERESVLFCGRFTGK